mgnify:CR=1 FL=1
MTQQGLVFQSATDLVAGVDEVGRGPLAGDVVAAAVILDPKQPIAGLTDSKALTAKILTTLSTSGYLTGAKGPGGGYALAKDPGDILLIDVVSCFEVQNNDVRCPIGDGWCVEDNPCPLHDQIQEVKKSMDKFLRENDFGGFSS